MPEQAASAAAGRWWLMRRGVLLGGAALVVVGIGITVGLLLAGDGDGDTQRQPAMSSTATATVVRRDLVESELVDGTLGFADARQVFTPRTGTLTWAPAVGSVVRTGSRLLQIDGASVFLFDGTTPAYRAMGPGVTGTDVLQVERTLRELGDDAGGAMRIDGTWDGGTTAAVRRWQARAGLDQTGRLEHGSIVFAPGSRRVAELGVKVGASVGSGAGGGAASDAAQTGAGTSVMTTTSTRRIVAVDLETTKQRLVRDGAAVQVTMPDDRKVKGTVIKVGRVARVPESAGGEAGAATVKVTIRLSGAARTTLDQAPVDVELEQERARDVLAVPVTALLAQEGGGFAVEVHERGRRRVIAVETGLSTDSMVQITGEGLREGMTVSNSAV